MLVLPSAATLLALMNYCAPMTTLTATAAGLGAGSAAQVWMLSGISLGLGATLLVAGGLADDRGRRRVFAAGAVLLSAASVVCAAAPDAGTFVAGRIAQGVGSAALIATGLGIIGHAYTGGPERARATGIWGAMLGAGIALGPIASSALAEAVHWRLWYWFTAVAALPLALAALRLLPESRADRRRGQDLWGALTMTAGVAALMTAITLGGDGWGRPVVLGLFAAAAGLLGVFCLVESRRREPMLDLRLFRHPGFVVSVLGALFTGLAVIGIMSYLSTVLERTLGLSPLGTSMVFGLWSGMAFLVALQARRLAPVLSARHLLAVGLLLSAVGEAGLLGTGPGDSWWRLVPGLAVAGVGSGLANAVLARLAVESVPADRAAMGAGAGNTARYVGASIGVAMVVALATAGGGGDAADPEALARGADLAIMVSAALALIAAVLAALIRDGGPTAGGSPAEAERQRGLDGNLRQGGVGDGDELP
ncbi:MFS transporter [Thermomonospora umbrina]|uniref:MFS transporter n=1 Tax=Thermomonospora umbrina TaxID=111806 RepID=A0A3D9T938_9ACTN|nr:MFS transporter [Thermomonospora umbrina]REF01175.1 MFS transporter [Thermomonospora umbrina]